MRAIAALHATSPTDPSSSDRADNPRSESQRTGSHWPRELEEDFWAQRKRANARRRRSSLALAALLVALFGILDGYVAPEAKVQLWVIRFGVCAPVVLALLATTTLCPLHRWSEMSVLLGVVVTGACVTAMTLIAPPHYAGILLVVFASYTLLGLRSLHASSAGLAVSLLYVIAAVVDGTSPRPIIVTNAFFLAGCNVIGAFVCYALEQAARREFLHGRARNRQRHLSERLLSKVLPAPVARRLKAHSGTIADAHPDVTILFADIVGFTAYAASTTPAQLVQLLDRVFTCFDQLAQKHGLDKIKTIGDAYMAAGGLRGTGFDHARAIAEMALDMIDAVKTFDPGPGRRFALRIGIHTGPVIAGVIGRTKFAYDLWGDTVNVASRLESLTTPGTIQVSESTYERLRCRYAFSPRSVLPVKGRGDLPSYVLLARRDDSESPADADTAPNTRMNTSAGGSTLASSHRTSWA